MLFGLVVLSIPYLRHRFYEAFYHLHILLAISYVGLMFWHSGNLGDSWAYLWATIAVWLASILARFFYFNQSFNVHNQWIEGSPTHVRESQPVLLGCNTSRRAWNSKLCGRKE